MSFLKIWDCEAYVKRLIANKLGPKSEKYYFVGYSKETKGYYFYNPTQNKMFVALNCVFQEREFFQREIVGVRYNLKKFENQRRLLHLFRKGIN